MAQQNGGQQSRGAQQNGRNVGAAAEIYGNISSMQNTAGAPGLANHPDANTHVESKFFAKRFISYVGNNMDFQGFVEDAVTQPAYTHTNDEGWHLIPYHSPVAAFNETKWFAGMADSEAFRIRDMGFEITDITPMSTKATSVAAATEIESDFSPELVLQVMTDPERDTEINRVNYSDKSLEFDHNVNFTRAIVKNQGDGALPRVKWGYTKDFVDVLKKNTNFTSSATKNDCAFSTVQMFQDYPIHKFVKGSKIRYVEKGATSWYPLGKVNRSNPCYSDKNDAKFTPVVSEFFQSAVSGKFGLTGNITPFVGMLESKGATTMNDLGRYHPMPVYIMGYPYVGKDGPIDITVQFEIKYFYKIDFKKRRCGTYQANMLDNPPASWATQPRELRIDKVGYSMAVPRQVNYPMKMWEMAGSGGDHDVFDGEFILRNRSIESDSDYMHVEEGARTPKRYNDEPSSSQQSPPKRRR